MTDKTNAKTPSKDGGEEMRPQMLESMGWLTESILIPRKGKTIEGVGAGTLVDLKAQFYQGQEQARQEKESGELRKGRKRKNEDDGIFGWTNRGVLERDRKDRLHLKSKEEVEADVAAQLEKKAELYDQLAQGEGPVDEDEVYEVDFLEKRFEQHVKKAKQPEETPPNETEWQEDEERKKRRELVLEQAGLTKKGRERAAQIKEARAVQQRQKRQQLRAAFIQKQLEKRRAEKQREDA